MGWCGGGLEFFVQGGGGDRVGAAEAAVSFEVRVEDSENPWRRDLA